MGLDERPLTSDVSLRQTTSYQAQDADWSIRAFRDDVLGAVGSQNFVDVRSPDEYAGRLLAPAPTCPRSRRSGPATCRPP